jgi:hypothetical protein
MNGAHERSMPGVADACDGLERPIRARPVEHSEVQPGYEETGLESGSSIPDDECGHSDEECDGNDQGCQAIGKTLKWRLLP